MSTTASTRVRARATVAGLAGLGAAFAFFNGISHGGQHRELADWIPVVAPVVAAIAAQIGRLGAQLLARGLWWSNLFVSVVVCLFATASETLAGIGMTALCATALIVADRRALVAAAALAFADPTLASASPALAFASPALAFASPALAFATRRVADAEPPPPHRCPPRADACPLLAVTTPLTTSIPFATPAPCARSRAANRTTLRAVVKLATASRRVGTAHRRPHGADGRSAHGINGRAVRSQMLAGASASTPVGARGDATRGSRGAAPAYVSATARRTHPGKVEKRVREHPGATRPREASG